MDLKDKNVGPNDRHFVIIRLFRNLNTLPTDVSKSCNPSECCLHSFKHSKTKTKELKRKHAICLGMGSLVSPVSLSLLQTRVIIPRAANIHHQGTEISQPLSVLPHLGAWEKPRFFQNDGLTECKITQIHVITIDVSENEIKISRLNIHLYMGKARDFKTFPQATYQKINFSLDLFLQRYFKIIK